MIAQLDPVPSRMFAIHRADGTFVSRCAMKDRACQVAMDIPGASVLDEVTGETVATAEELARRRDRARPKARLPYANGHADELDLGTEEEA